MNTVVDPFGQFIGSGVRPTSHRHLLPRSVLAEYPRSIQFMLSARAMHQRPSRAETAAHNLNREAESPQRCQYGDVGLKYQRRSNLHLAPAELGNDRDLDPQGSGREGPVCRDTPPKDSDVNDSCNQCTHQSSR